MRAHSKAGGGRRATVPQPDQKSALLVGDIQVDFCPGGALGVPGGDEIIPVVNECIRRFHARQIPVIAVRDWHPPTHCSFKEQGGIWPVHCVQMSRGAQFHPDLVVPPGTFIVSKATDPKKEAYSSFEGTTLEGRLRELGVETLFVTGLATDYCVKNTVLDARRLGFRVVVLEDAIRGIDATPGDCDRAVQAMKQAGALFARSSDLLL
ncbi:MAG: nicotinamidase [Nitrospirota bacterium]